MKTFENRFGANIELRNVGDHVVAAKVSLPFNFDRVDHKCISDCILTQLLPAWVGFHCLYDGTYILISDVDKHYASNLCIPSETRSLSEFGAVVELEDGHVHTVHICLEQSDDVRRDYLHLDSRFISLRGKITVEFDDDEASED